MFSINQRVCLKNNPERKGSIQAGPFLVNGYNVYQVMFDDNTQASEHEINLQNEIIAKSAWDKLAKNSFGDYQNYSIVSTISKIRNASTNTISTLKASRTLFRPYQFIPLVKMLNSYNRRILIADEVGLGKTIAAGHILLEYMARGEVNNLLIVCPNALKEKWKDEMENKFNIRLKIYNETRDFKDDLIEFKENGQNIFGIVNYEKFRSRDNLKFYKEYASAFDMMIFDEAQRLRNSKSKKKKDPNTAKAIRNFTPLAKGIVMLSATPIMTSLENLFNLIEILDKNEYSKYEVFQNNININKPLIRAFNQLNSKKNAFSDIADELETVEVETIFKYGEYDLIERLELSKILKGDQLFQNVIQSLRSYKDTKRNRAILRDKLVSLNSLNHIYSRTRKIEVLDKNEYVQRNANLIAIDMTDEEREIYQDIIYDNYNFGGMMTKRNYASSLFSPEYTEKELENPNLIIESRDSKYNLLKEVLTKSTDKVIVFSYFRKTLLYLKNRLESEEYRVGLIYGGVKVDERNKVIERFKNGEFNILLTSEVGSTGLDMQFCDTMVNYDLPWNPMVVEQRIGRIDRIGQESEVINIFNLVYNETIEEKIYKRLYDRINIFREALGDLDDVLGKKERYIEGIIKELYQKKLSKEEVEKRLDQVGDAIENNRISQQRVREGLEDSFSHDYYFEEQINNIERKGRFLQSNELVDLVSRIINHHLTSMIFTETNNPNVYKIRQNNSNQLFSFIEGFYDDTNEELQKVYNSFRARNYPDLELYVTFDQEFAFENKQYDYISSFHPLINAISNYFHQQSTGRNEVFKFGLNRKHFPESLNLTNGLYILINYSLNIDKVMLNRKTNSLIIKSIAIDLEKDEDYILDEETAELLNAEAQKNRSSIPGGVEDIFTEDLKNVIQDIFVKESFSKKLKLEEEEKLKFNSEVERKRNQEIAEIEKRIERIQYNLDSEIGLPGPQKQDILELEEKKNKIVADSEKSLITVSDSLISINLIQVYG